MFSCPRCKLCLNDLNQLHYHIKKTHPKLLKSSIKCGQAGCPRYFSDFSGLRRHLKSCTFPPVNMSNEITAPDVFDLNTEDISFIEDDSFIKYDTNNSETVKNVCELIYDSENCDSNDNGSEFKESDLSFMHENALNFIAEFYAIPDLSRKVVQTIIEKTTDLMTKNLSSASNIIDELLKDTVSTEDLAKVKNVLSALNQPFKGLETEHSRFVSLHKKGVFHYPESFVCGRKGTEVLTGQFLSVKLILKRFFELPGVFETVKQYVASLEEESKMGVISNFIQGEYWQQKCREDFVGKFVLPLFYHFDEVEMGNALGSHSNIHKLAATYAKCPGVPLEFQSMLENHFLVLLFHAVDRKADNPFLAASNNAVLFNKLIDEMNDIRENGLDINTVNGLFTIFFDLGLVLGDNAGLHSVLGFVESFRANFPCFICKVPNCESQSLCSENVDLLRTKENYGTDLALNDVSQTGIKEDCVFHKINNFHVTKAYVCDWMHDGLEGCCKYDLLSIFKELIFVKKYFSIGKLQCIMLNHDYGDVSNKPPLILQEDLTNDNIRMSANEMLIFVQHLPIMIGELVPSNDEHWQLLSFLYDIVLALMATSFTVECIKRLDYLIVQHHLLYVRLFGKTLKPKHHHMLHYCRIIRLCGPPVHLWSMRFESKHRFLKRYSNVCFSRVNLSLSVALKVELNFAFRVLSQKGFPDRFSMSSKHEIVFNPVKHIPGFESKCASVKFVTVNGVCFRIGSCVLDSLDCEGTPVFGLVNNIYVNRQHRVCLSLSKLIWDVYDTHLHAYFVHKSPDNYYVLLDELPLSKPVLLHTMPNQSLAVSLLHGL